MTTKTVNPVNPCEPPNLQSSRQKTAGQKRPVCVNVNFVNFIYTWVWGGTLTTVHGGYPFAYRVHKVHTPLWGCCLLAFFCVNPLVHADRLQTKTTIDEINFDKQLSGL
jgi:hypothetical protein